MNEEEDLKVVREGLIAASKAEDPTEMWYATRDALNLLTMILNPEAPVLTDREVEALDQLIQAVSTLENSVPDSVASQPSESSDS